jgi:hypothetical protein
MATTIPEEFHGKARLGRLRLGIIGERYRIALGDADKATEPSQNAYYQGVADALEDVLLLLHQKKKTIPVQKPLFKKET